MLAWPPLSPDIWPHRRQQAPQAPFPALSPDPPLALPLEPTTLAPRLAQAFGPEHRRIRWRTSREYSTEEQARWRIIERVAVGVRPRRVATRWDIPPAVVDHWKRRFAAAGLLGLTTRPRTGTPITTRVPVHVSMAVCQRLDTQPWLGHSRVKMA